MSPVSFIQSYSYWSLQGEYDQLLLVLREVSQPQDLIMAAVDRKGTMKDFCSITCLCSFKSKPRAQPTQPTPQTPPCLPTNVSTASTQTSLFLCRKCGSRCSVRRVPGAFLLPAERFPL